MREQIVVRMAQPGDVAGIVALVNDYASDSVMLPVSAERVTLALDDFVIATDGRGRVRACGALKEYSPSLAEVASLAVARDAHGSGLGRRIVGELESLARMRGINELFALTMTAGFFEAVGYCVTERTKYPEKIRRDCSTCSRRVGCTEVCVARMLRADTLEYAAYDSLPAASELTNKMKPSQTFGRSARLIVRHACENDSPFSTLDMRASCTEAVTGTCRTGSWRSRIRLRAPRDRDS